MRKSGLVALVAVVSSAILASLSQACGDDPVTVPGTPDGAAPSETSTTGGDATSTVPTPTCPEACAQAASSAACAGKTYEEAPCQRLCACIVGAFRADLVPGALACVAGCREGGEDQCLADNFAAYVDDPVTKGTVAACSARQSECRDAGTSLGTDVCALFGAKPEFMTKIRDCLLLPCADARACVTATYAEAGCAE